MNQQTEPLFSSSERSRLSESQKWLLLARYLERALQFRPSEALIGVITNAHLKSPGLVIPWRVAVENHGNNRRITDFDPVQWVLLQFLNRMGYLHNSEDLAERWHAHREICKVMASIQSHPDSKDVLPALETAAERIYQAASGVVQEDCARAAAMAAEWAVK